MDMDFFFDQILVMEKERAAERNQHAQAVENMGF